ncbi:MAG: YifB family Mg chelatase-like AAA ATPase [Micropruina sp.]|uniref:YifB family Mg chelatase-like AAA ATPase n=1 Tax=Micropruina sp. TaxID=2737536 RepID=UPI0039E47535
MTPARAFSVALVGVEGTIVEVEAAIGGGLPRMVIVGLADAALAEARERCRAAVHATGLGWPAQLVTVNLSPATLPKAGSHFDLAIVAAVSAAADRFDRTVLERLVLFGELGLDGRVRPVRGLLPALLAAASAGFAAAVVPAAQLREAQLVDGLTLWGVNDLLDLVSVLVGDPPKPPPEQSMETQREVPPTKDLSDVAGQLEAKWALEVAAAGRHHLFFHGPPGVGKTLLAERLPGILPDLDTAEALEVSAIHSLAGLPLDGGLIRRPPYADPHHTASLASVVGGGARVAQPGSISRAHRGVLLLDEAPEFSPRVLEALRVPLESGRVVLGRAAAQTTYPASFQLVLASNPCPCGNAGTAGAECRCAPMAVRRYTERISGPILDRVDIRHQLRPMSRSYLKAALGGGESSAAVAARVAEARERQRHRLAEHGWRTNGEVPGPALRRRLPLPDGTELLDEAVARGRLSARGVDKVIRLSWTIADLAGVGRPGRDHLHTALAMRHGLDLTEVRGGRP